LTHNSFFWSGVKRNWSLSQAGFRPNPPSAKNASYEALNGSFLEGRVDQNVEGLRLLLEPGKFARPNFGRFTPEDFQAMQRRRNELLQGAPASADSDKAR
jgi:hypothetical protein